MIYDYKKVVSTDRFIEVLRKVEKKLAEYKSCLNLLQKAQAEFLYEVLSLRVGDSIPIAAGWSGHIVSLSVENAETFLNNNFCAYSLQYLPYRGEKIPVDVPRLPTIPLRIVNTPTSRDEFQKKTGITVNKSIKADRLRLRVQKQVYNTAAMFERISSFLLSQGRKFCPFKEDGNIFALEEYTSGGNTLGLTESNPGMITSIGYLYLNPDTGLVYFPPGKYAPAGVEHPYPRSLFRLEAFYAGNEGNMYYSTLPQNSCTGWGQSMPKKKRNMAK